MPNPMEGMDGGNPDSGADRELIMSVIQENLGPVFEALTSRLQELDERLMDVKDLQEKFTNGLIGAADTHRRGMLGEELDGKYGKEFEPFEEFHKSVYGKGFKDSLLDELMGDEGPGDEERDSWIQNKLNDAKGKFGKYVGIKAEIPGETKIEAGPLGEMEEGEEKVKEGEAKEEEGEKEEEIGEKEEEEGKIPESEAELKKSEKIEKEGEAEERAGEAEEEDSISKLMKQMHDLTGARHKLSEPITPKKSKAPARR